MRRLALRIHLGPRNTGGRRLRELSHNAGVWDERDPPLPDVARVECYAGYRGEQDPRGFISSDGADDVVEVVDRWQGPDHRVFVDEFLRPKLESIAAFNPEG